MLLYSSVHGSEFGLQGIDLFFGSHCPLLPYNRQVSLQRAQKVSTHLLCIDDDMKFPPDSLRALTSHDVDCVGVNYVCKNPKALKFTAHDTGHNPIDSRQHSGIEEVGLIGFGMVLTKVSALENIPAPHIEIVWDPATNDYKPEDFYFCEKVRRHGLKIHVDHDLSNRVSHIGNFDYSAQVFKT